MKIFKSVEDLTRKSKRLVHFIVFAVCIIVSTYQLVECFKKLRNPPISTRYTIVSNETLNYPAITICRNPPYKASVLQYYNLGNLNSSMEYTSEWQNFNFKNITLQQVWNNATYRQDEVVQIYGLHGQAANAEIVENYYYYNGKCFTFLPRVGSVQPWPDSGWSIMLRHNRPEYDHSEPNKLGAATENEINGFHIYIHEVREPWTENVMQTKYIMQYLYMEVGEEIEVKINAEEFKGISTMKRPCVSDMNYSRYKCIEQHHWTNISKAAGCTVPWMKSVVGLPHCNKYEPLLQLINSYKTFADMDDFRCENNACNSTAFKLFIVKRHEILKPYSQLFVYYTSKMVTVMQELPGYDANAFLADLGGSLGFFLGLSVVGFIGLLEKTFSVVVCYAKPILKDDKSKKEEANEKV